MDAAAEIGRNPVSEHQIQPEYGDEQADAGAMTIIFYGLLKKRENNYWMQLFYERYIIR